MKWACEGVYKLESDAMEAYYFETTAIVDIWADTIEAGFSGHDGLENHGLEHYLRSNLQRDNSDSLDLAA